MQMTDEQFSSRNKTELQKIIQSIQTTNCGMQFNYIPFSRAITTSRSKAIKNYTKSRSIVRLSSITFPTTLRDAHYSLQLKETKAHDETSLWYRQFSFHVIKLLYIIHLK